MSDVNKGEIFYKRGTKELKQKSIRAHKLVQEFNMSDVEEFEKKTAIIQELFGSVGENVSSIKKDI